MALQLKTKVEHLCSRLGKIEAEETKEIDLEKLQFKIFMTRMIVFCCVSLVMTYMDYYHAFVLV